MSGIPTILRLAEHEALSDIRLEGSVLDLGGEKDAQYLLHLKGDFAVTAVNMDAGARPDVMHDLEQPLPMPDEDYDNVLLMNVLEHVFEYRQLLMEAVRVLRPGGQLVVVVPFLFPIHPDPHDYWRFSGEALRKELERLELSDICIIPLGCGVFAAHYVMLDRLMPGPVRFIMFHTVRRLVPVLDRLFVDVARALGKKYLASDYALGYCVTARR